MASSGPRFCPRCGTGRIGEMGFCPNCGLDLRQLPGDERSLGEPPASPGGSAPTAPTAPVTPVSPGSPAVPVVPPSAASRYETVPEGWIPGRLLVPGLLVLALLLGGAWAAGLGPFAPGADPGRPGAGATQAAVPTSPYLPPVTSQPSFAASPGFTAPPVGLTILSPADGSVVGAREVTVIGTAPPGLRITQDISFGLDRHATTDGTGHWAIQAELSEGENRLRFRIGDDPSTTQTIRVIYVPPATP